MRRYSGKKGASVKGLLLCLLLLGVLGYGCLLGAVCLGSRDELRGEPEVMIVLGCQVHPWGPSVLLQDRLDTALGYLQEHPETTVVVSGGQGADEPMSEAACMGDYLTAQGFPQEQILLEDGSHNTWQNLNNSLDLLSREGIDTTQEVVIVSNGFHLTRVRMLYNRLYSGDYLSTLAAPSSHAPSRVKMYLREPLALIKSFLLDR